MTGDPLAGKDQARGAFLALAGGARFGGPFAFIRDASVQTGPVHPGNWTEDTHRSLYLGGPSWRFGWPRGRRARLSLCWGIKGGRRAAASLLGSAFPRL